jgi:hypothetical protein
MNPQISTKLEELTALLEEVRRNLVVSGMKSAEDTVQNWINGLAWIILDVALQQTPEPCLENRISVEGQILHFKSTQKRRIKDRFGEVHTIQRRVYRSKSDGMVCIPKDEALGLSPTGEASPGLEFIVDTLAAFEAYRPVATFLQTLFHIDFGPTGVQKTAERSGELIGSDVEDLVSPEWQGERCDTMILTVDATGSPRIADAPIPGRGREALKNPTISKMCTLIQLEKYIDPLPARKTFRDEPPKPDRCVTVGTYSDGGFEEADRHLRTVALRGGRTRARVIVFKADGAPANWRQCTDYFPEAIQVLDPFHAVEHLASFARLTHRLTPEQPLPPVFSKWKESLLSGDILNLLEDLKVAVKGARPGDRSAAEREISYFQTNTSRMEYDRYLAMGIPIGTGNIESAAKRIIASRFKKQGMRWRPEDNRAILNLRLHVINDSLEKMFKQRVQHRCSIINAA